MDQQLPAYDGQVTYSNTRQLKTVENIMAALSNVVAAHTIEEILQFYHSSHCTCVDFMFILFYTALLMFLIYIDIMTKVIQNIFRNYSPTILTI